MDIDRGGIGLILMGGGARAAYQAGVLDGLREILEEAGWPALRNPYTVVCGTSAGAINAAVLAAVPEPATYALMLAGLGLVAWGSRRRPSRARS